MVIISSESIALYFVSMQAELLYTAKKEPVPLYVKMMRCGLEKEEDFLGGLFSFAQRGLDAVKQGRNFCPESYEFGSLGLAAYETTQQFARVAMVATENMLLAHEVGREELLPSLREMNLSLILAKGMYSSLQEKAKEGKNSESVFPLANVREYALEQYQCALDRIVGGSELREEFQEAY